LEAAATDKGEELGFQDAGLLTISSLQANNPCGNGFISKRFLSTPETLRRDRKPATRPSPRNV